MKILVVNAGSSSVKFTLFSAEDYSMLAGGIVERIGLSGTKLKYRSSGKEMIEKEVEVRDTQAAVRVITDHLTDATWGVIEDVGEIAAVGHRVVHGGERFSRPIAVDAEVKQVIAECAELAPLHNPPNLKGIEACEGQLPGVPQVAVFDTAFHATIPEYAYLYGIPYRFYREYRIRRYGFHGISHKYVCSEAARFLKQPLAELKIISCHLGNGCSITAVDGGRSVDTSMGFTPLEGLIMGTRCGDLDPAVVCYLMEYKQLDHFQISNLLNKESGLLGLSELGSSDLRDILSAMDAGNERAKSTLLTFAYRIKKYIGAYAAAMGWVDAIVFTGGIGENAARVRELAIEGLGSDKGLGATLDGRCNANGNGRLCEIQGLDSRIKILVVPTNEEREIAMETVQILMGQPSSNEVVDVAEVVG